MPTICPQSSFHLRLSVACELRDAPRFYLPHNMDFRGRAYPIHPHLHHMGEDSTRGLLLFAEAKPLGKHGLDWLLAHIANVWGHGEDKRSTAERRAFAKAHLDQVSREQRRSTARQNDADSDAPVVFRSFMAASLSSHYCAADH